MSNTILFVTMRDDRDGVTARYPPKRQSRRWSVLGMACRTGRYVRLRVLQADQLVPFRERVVERMMIAMVVIIPAEDFYLCGAGLARDPRSASANWSTWR